MTWCVKVRFPSKVALFIYSPQCACHDDVINFRLIMRQWVNIWDLNYAEFTNNGDSKDIPFFRRYSHMARADRSLALDDDIAVALRPESDFDREESAMWLNHLLRRIRKHVRSR